MDAQACIWDLPSATPLSTLYLPDEGVRALSISSDLANAGLLLPAVPSGHQQQSSLDVVSVNSGDSSRAAVTCALLISWWPGPGTDYS